MREKGARINPEKWIESNTNKTREFKANKNDSNLSTNYFQST